jgi:hypothetical protein
MKHQEMLKSLSNCINYCNWCADACLDEDNVKDMVKCIRLDRACSYVCAATANILDTRYDDIQGLVNYCIQICEDCEKECKKFDSDHCQQCAKACRECADACRRYAA